MVDGDSSILVFSSPLWSPGPAVVCGEHGGLDELAEAGDSAVPQVSPSPGPREPARHQEPHVAPTEDHQELLGHGLEGAREVSEQSIHQTTFSPCFKGCPCCLKFEL